MFREGPVEFFHYDLYSQALAKLERGFSRDCEDVQAMVKSGAVVPSELAELFRAIADDLYRFPAVEPAALAAAVHELVGESQPDA